MILVTLVDFCYLLLCCENGILLCPKSKQTYIGKSIKDTISDESLLELVLIFAGRDLNIRTAETIILLLEKTPVFLIKIAKNID